MGFCVIRGLVKEVQHCSMRYLIVDCCENRNHLCASGLLANKPFKALQTRDPVTATDP